MNMTNRVPELNVNVSNYTIPNHTLPNLEPTDPNLASEFCKRIIKMINDFDRHLNHEQEAGMHLVSFGQSITFYVQGIGYLNPSLIIFYGTTEDGEPMELMQHVSQISFLLMAVKRLNPEIPKRKIGFNQIEN